MAGVESDPDLSQTGNNSILAASTLDAGQNRGIGIYDGGNSSTVATWDPDVSQNDNNSTAATLALGVRQNGDSSIVRVAASPVIVEMTQTDTAMMAADPVTGNTVLATRRSRTARVETENGICYISMEEIRLIGIIQDREAAEATGEDDDEGSTAEDSDDLYQETCCDRCCDICTSRIGISEDVCCTADIRPSMIGHFSALKLKSLRLAQKSGIRELKGKVFPLFTAYTREIQSYVLLLYTIFSLIRGIVNFVQDDMKTTINSVDIGVSSASSVLSLLNLFIVLYFIRCRIARDVCNKCRGIPLEQATAIGYEQKGVDVGLEEEAAVQVPCDKCCKFCCKNKYADLVRILLVDLLAYPITICSIFELLLGILLVQENEYNILGIVLFALQTINTLATVYLSRLLVIGKTIRKIELALKGRQYLKSARWFHVHFFFHVFGQILTQVLMVVCIGARFYYENRNYSANSTVSSNQSVYENGNYSTVTNTVQVSPYLWYMIVGGLVIPFVGVFTFIIGNYYSVQEYPIVYFAGSILRTVGVKEEMTEEKFEKIAVRIQDGISSSLCLYNYFYVFFNPLLVVLSVVYTLSLLVFAACCMLDQDPVSGVKFVVVYGISLGWIIFFLVGIGLVIFTNILVLMVGGLYLAIIVCVFLIIAFVILVIISIVIEFLIPLLVCVVVFYCLYNNYCNSN